MRLHSRVSFDDGVSDKIGLVMRSAGAFVGTVVVSWIGLGQAEQRIARAVMVYRALPARRSFEQLLQQQR